MTETTADHQLLDAVLEQVRQAPDGQTEHALLGRLEKAELAPFAGADLGDQMALFRVHFLLFHCLYRLQERLAARGEWLDIHCLSISLRPLSSASTADTGAMAQTDPLRTYYLELANLDAMDAATLEAMLSGFWQRLDGGERHREALDLLGLEEPVDADQVTRRYRQLAQQHHPDKGGDTETLQRLNEARLVLIT